MFDTWDLAIGVSMSQKFDVTLRLLILLNRRNLLVVLDNGLCKLFWQRIIVLCTISEISLEFFFEFGSQLTGVEWGCWYHLLQLFLFCLGQRNFVCDDNFEIV